MNQCHETRVWKRQGTEKKRKPFYLILSTILHIINTTTTANINRHNLIIFHSSSQVTPTENLCDLCVEMSSSDGQFTFSPKKKRLDSIQGQKQFNSKRFCTVNWCTWHPGLMPHILVWFSWLYSELVWILSVISIVLCQMWQPSIFLVFLFLQCSSGLCSWSFAFHHVHHSPRHSHLFPFSQPPALCRWHSTLLLLPSTWLWLKHYSPSKCSTADLFVDDCQSFNSQFLQDRIPAHRTQ